MLSCGENWLEQKRVQPLVEVEKYQGRKERKVGKVGREKKREKRVEK